MKIPYRLNPLGCGGTIAVEPVQGGRGVFLFSGSAPTSSGMAMNDIMLFQQQNSSMTVWFGGTVNGCTLNDCTSAVVSRGGVVSNAVVNSRGSLYAHSAALFKRRDPRRGSVRLRRNVITPW